MPAAGGEYFWCQEKKRHRAAETETSVNGLAKEMARPKPRADEEFGSDRGIIKR